MNPATVTYGQRGDQVAEHPAKYADRVLSVFSWWLEPGMRVLDPMAGVGGIHRLRGVETWSVELEPEWVDETVRLYPHAATRALCGDCRQLGRLGLRDGFFDAICVSPVYGNRMSDHHDARDASKRYTYRHQLGRMPTEGSSAVLHWGELYRQWHADEAWPEAVRVLRPGGLFLLNVSDHMETVGRGADKRVVQQPVADWHRATLEGLGLRLEGCRPVATRRMRYGQNHRARVDAEMVFALRKPE